MASGDAVQVRATAVKEHSTQPPGRFSEGTLVKELEALGIGRPSTYSAIIRLLQVRTLGDQPDNPEVISIGLSVNTALHRK